MYKSEEILNTIILGDSSKVLKEFPDNFIDTTVTSCPYDDLRSYKGKVTKETNFNGYSFPFEEIAKELYRITKPGGVIVWVVGDAINNNGSETGTSFRQALYFKSIGFNIHDTMIYEKVGIAFPSNNRYYQAFEYMFVLSKGKPKTFNPIKDRENRWAGEQGSWGKRSNRNNKDELIARDKNEKITPKFGTRYNIWRINNQRGWSTEDVEAHKIHPAIFPEELVRDHIISWSNEGDIVLDCFSGSATTAKMAKKLKRNYIGIEINQEYYDYSIKRLQNYGSNNLEDILEY